jgi:hypothetical protein
LARHVIGEENIFAGVSIQYEGEFSDNNWGKGLAIEAGGALL